MAVDTDIALQNQVIYSIYVRNHTPEGTFCAVMSDLDRIRALGTDIIWFMPIHPIGEKGKKGSLGCPYANRDYRTVNPYYGTMEDFRALVAAIHALVNYTALLYFLKGTTLIYAGQEFENEHLPSLFERDVIDRGTGRDLSSLMRRLYEIKSAMLGTADWFFAEADDARDVAVCRRGGGGRRFVGVFSLKARSGEVSVDAPDGEYEELISGGAVSVAGGKLACTGTPVIIRVE